MSFLGVVTFLICLPAALMDFAMPIWKQQPAMQIEDAYKWTFQATRGGEHAAPSREMAKKWLDREWASIGSPLKDEPVWEPLCADNSIGRLNLRPFRAGTGDTDALIDAFVAGASEFKGNREDFLAAWNELGKRLEKAPVGNLDLEKWKAFDKEMAKKDYPAVHHSAKYNETYSPAYRILPETQMKKLLKK